MDEKLYGIIKNSDRYKEFILLDESISFDKLFKNENFDSVQLHSTQIIKYKDGTESIVGFCGAFEWRDNKLTSLDGDLYSESTEVLGYHEFKFTEQGSLKSGLDILVDAW